MAKLTDESSMPFGKYKGIKLAEIPDSHFLYIYANFNLEQNMIDYIEDSFNENDLKRAKSEKNDDFS